MISVTTSQFHLHYKNSKHSRVFFQMFHVNLLNLEIASIAVHLMFQGNTTELCQFFNQIFSKCNGLIENHSERLCVRKNLYQKRDKLFILLVLSFISVNLMFSLIVPLTTFLFPVVVRLNNIRLSMYYKLLFILKTVNVIHLFGMIPVGMVGSQTAVLAFVALNEIRVNLYQLRILTENARYGEMSHCREKNLFTLQRSTDLGDNCE